MLYEPAHRPILGTPEMSIGLAKIGGSFDSMEIPFLILVLIKAVYICQVPPYFKVNHFGLGRSWMENHYDSCKREHQEKKKVSR